jgi:hypothetical protein
MFAKLQERPLDQKEKESSCGVDAELNPKKRGEAREIDGVSYAELFDPVNNQFLNQVSAVGDAGDEGGARNCNSTEWEPWTDHANKKCGHPDGDERELPDARNDGEVFGFAEIQCVND